jgi:hypothetical protein
MSRSTYDCNGVSHTSGERNALNESRIGIEYPLAVAMNEAADLGENVTKGVRRVAERVKAQHIAFRTDRSGGDATVSGDHVDRS